MSESRGIPPEVQAPFVSVVLPTRNRAAALLRAVETVRRQTLAAWELLIVDDGSDDDTPEQISALAAADPRIRGVRQPHQQGAAAARNAGIQRARGRWVAFLDDDAEWSAGKLHAQVTHAGGDDRAFVYGLVLAVDDDGSIERLGGPLDRRDPNGTLLSGNRIDTSAVLVGREPLLEVEGFDTALPRLQDWDLWLRLMPRVHALYLDQPLARTFRVGPRISTEPANLPAAAARMSERHESVVLRETLGHMLLEEGHAEMGRALLRRAAREGGSGPRLMVRRAVAALLPGAYPALARFSKGVRRRLAPRPGPWLSSGPQEPLSADPGSLRATVIIPTWNGVELLDRALNSLRRQSCREHEVIVVDNGSEDGTVERLAREWPDVRVIRFEENRGFAPAASAGIEASRSPIVVLLNNDAEVDPPFLAELIRPLEEDPTLGSSAAKVLQADAPGLIDSAGIRVGLFPSQIGHGEPDGPDFASPRDVFAPSGGAAAYRKEAIARVGGFDDRFFAYFEDADLGCRLRLAGYGCRYVPTAVAHHVGSATARRIPAWKFYLLMRNGLFVFFQNMPLRRVIRWAPVVLAWPFVRARLDRIPLRVAARAVIDFARDLPTVREGRRRALGLRRVPWSRYSELLASPFTRARQPLVPAADPSPPGPGS